MFPDFEFGVFLGTSTLIYVKTDNREYLHLPSIFPIKCVGGPSVFMRAWLHRYANQHSAIYIVLLRAYEDVDVNG